MALFLVISFSQTSDFLLSNDQNKIVRIIFATSVYAYLFSDDQYADMSNSSFFINDDNKMKVNEINDSQLSKV